MEGQNGGSGTWQEWLTVNVGICPRYSQILREVAKLLKNYSIFQNVGISFSEIYRRKEQITNLLQTNSIAECHWQGVDPIDGYNTERTRSALVSRGGALSIPGNGRNRSSLVSNDADFIYTWQWPK